MLVMLFQQGCDEVVVTGATGNAGTAVLNADPDIDQVVAVARRPPSRSLLPAEFDCADVTADRREHFFSGPGAVVHLAWLIQSGRESRSRERSMLTVAGAYSTRPSRRGAEPRLRILSRRLLPRA